jgi:ABC-type multidrug transport system fused ATPase/permease subunit
VRAFLFFIFNFFTPVFPSFFLSLSSAADTLTPSRPFAFPQQAAVQARTYMSYMLAAGWGWMLVSVVNLILMQAMRNGVDLWLAQWVTDYHSNSTAALLGPPLAASPPTPTTGTQSPAVAAIEAALLDVAKPTTPNDIFFVRILCLLAMLGVLFTGGRELGSALAGLRASRRLHEVLLRTILTLPLSFFSPRHVRQALNSFSRDVASFSSSLPCVTNVLMERSASFLGLAIVLGLGQPWHFVALLPGAIIIGGLRRYYTSSCIELSRVEVLTRGPVVIACIESVPGGATMRAHGVQSWFQSRQHTVVKDHVKSKMALLAAREWLSFRVQIFSALLVGAIGCLTVADAARVLPIFYHRHMSIGVVGLSLCYTLSLVDILGSCLTASADTEKHMVRPPMPSHTE